MITKYGPLILKFLDFNSNSIIATWGKQIFSNQKESQEGFSNLINKMLAILAGKKLFIREATSSLLIRAASMSSSFLRSLQISSLGPIQKLKKILRSSRATISRQSFPSRVARTMKSMEFLPITSRLCATKKESNTRDARLKTWMLLTLSKMLLKEYKLWKKPLN